MPQSLTEFLAQHEKARGTATALVYADKSVTYAALAAESRRVAHGLADLGVTAGDRVALWLPNVPAWLACFFACAQLGAIAVTVNTRFRSNEVADIVGRAGAKVLGSARRLPAYRLRWHSAAMCRTRSRTCSLRRRRRDQTTSLRSLPSSSAGRVPLSPGRALPELTANHAAARCGLQHLHDLRHDARAQVRAPSPGRRSRATRGQVARGFGIDCARDATTC